MHLILFPALALLSFFVPWQIFLVLAFLYGMYYDAPELLPLGFLLDTLYGVDVPWLPIPAVYSLALLGILILLWGIKPFLSFYETD